MNKSNKHRKVIIIIIWILILMLYDDNKKPKLAFDQAALLNQIKMVELAEMECQDKKP